MKPLADLSSPLTPPSLEAERNHEPGYFKGRRGFNPNFIPEFQVELPTLSKSLSDDAAPLVTDANKHVLDYENFSLVMSKSRRLAIYTACNIEGEQSKRDKVARQGKDEWFYDLRISPHHQIGEDLYRDNELDRGHLVRREDPVWGDKAVHANDDTFHFTNCSPQHSGFNQKTWLGLENYILQNARLHELKATVFTGPVFTPNDPLYRGVRIPRSYWKVVSVFSEEQRSATAYEIKQDHLLEGLEFLYGKYKTHQVSIHKVERMTGLKFGPLSTYDGFSNEEATVGSEVSMPLSDWRAIRI
ncbi:DNA/RNA non-specific endonuclease [Corallococcus exiguus]|uniref:DNA/RNA non-specific endonuclease n=1 Tax=Corallococcus exiguus TaxID=83462 RepID=UPI001A90829E|nr:DNA/RNA non-specific endonuclease [Corallococcus exiguus]MBN8471196.1 DNA/RNA non-specific endonuclease [Corallococcus exiguus]